MKIKVCGIRDHHNLDFLEKSDIDFIGFIFYDKSKRNFPDGNLTDNELLSCIKKKIGVFVNEDIEVVLKNTKRYQLDGIQLHGAESPAYCKAVRSQLGKTILLFKSFPVSDEFPANMSQYEEIVDYFLLDTKGKEYGGNGTKFDWFVLNKYKFNTPFILSGGIGPNEVKSVKEINHPKLYAVDVNSRFEMKPGLKDNASLDEFIKDLKK